MYKHLTIFCMAILILIAFGLTSCDGKNKAVEKPKVVSKKIPEVEKQTDETSDKGKTIDDPEMGKKQLASTQPDQIENEKQEVNLSNEDIDVDSDGDQAKNIVQTEENDQLEQNQDENEVVSDENGENETTLGESDVEHANNSEEKRKAAELLANFQKESNSSSGNSGSNFDNLNNPFLPLFSDAPVPPKENNSSKRPKRKILRTPLTIVDLSQLKLVATLRATSGNRALVEDSTGKGYVVDKGTNIGINGGSVVEINKESIVVEEELETLTGDVKIQRREIKLQKAPGE